MKLMMAVMALCMMNGSELEYQATLEQIMKEEFHRTLAQMVEAKKQQKPLRFNPYPPVDPSNGKGVLSIKQRLKQTEDSKMDTTAFLKLHLDIANDPRLEHLVLQRFKVFMHCVQWIVADNRLEDVENKSRNQDIFSQINNKVGSYLGRYWAIAISDDERAQIKDLVQNDDGESFVGIVEDLHYLCMHSKAKFMIQIIRRFINQGGFRPLQLFSRQQILDLYERMKDLRFEIWGDADVRFLNEGLRDVYWQLSLFDQMAADNGECVPLPLSIYHQMVDDLIDHELNNKYFCYKWLLRQINNEESKRVLQAYMKVYSDKIGIVFHKVLPFLRTADPRVKSEGQVMIEDFKREFPGEQYYWDII